MIQIKDFQPLFDRDQEPTLEDQKALDELNRSFKCISSSMNFEMKRIESADAKLELNYQIAIESLACLAVACSNFKELADDIIRIAEIRAKYGIREDMHSKLGKSHESEKIRTNDD